MFLREFGLAVHPFGLSPRLDFLYKSGAFEESIAHLVYGLENNEAFVMITGAIGTGKTMAIQSFLLHLGDRYMTALVTNTSVDPKELLKLVLEDLGVPLEPGADKSDLLIAFKKFLVAAGRDGKRIVVVIDEAQNLSREALEEIRLLTNLGQGDEQPVQIVLAGQPELEEVLQRADLAQLRQRIRVHYKLAPLSRRELEEYVDHRMTVAGGSAGAFSGRALDRVYELSHGIPRVVNTLCGDGLLAAYVAGRQKVEAEDIGETAAGPAPAAFERSSTYREPLRGRSADGHPTPTAEPKPTAIRPEPQDVRPVASQPAPEMARRQKPRAKGGAVAANSRRRPSAVRVLGVVAAIVALVVAGFAATGKLTVLRGIGEDLHLPGLTARAAKPVVDRPEPSRPEPTPDPVAADVRDTEAPGDSTGASATSAGPTGEPATIAAKDVAPATVDSVANSTSTLAERRQNHAPVRASTDPAPAANRAPTSEEAPSDDHATSGGPVYLHVSSFRTPDHAHGLAKQYTEAGLSTAVRQQVVRDVTWYRVYIGPFGSHAEAVARANALRDTGAITYYKVMPLGDGEDQ